MEKLLCSLVMLAATAATADTLEVRIVNMQFEPQVLTVKPGDTVRWLNQEKRTYHSVLFKEEGVPESAPLFPGESHERKFEQAGSFPYDCGPHPHMKGQIRVQP